MTDTVIYLENRGGGFIFHWFLYNIAGLLDFTNQAKPIKFSIDISEPFHGETIELLKPDFEFIDPKNLNNYKIIKYHGAPLLSNNIEVDKKYYIFLRNQILFKNSLNKDATPHRKLYISRNKSHLLKANQDCFNGNIKRKIFKEDVVYSILEGLGFEFIYLEDYSLKDKINLFQDASMIVTPNGGALTLALFAHEKTKLVEIHSKIYDGHDQYMILCKNIGLWFERYDNTTVVNNDIYIHDGNHFRNFIQDIINIT